MQSTREWRKRVTVPHLKRPSLGIGGEIGSSSRLPGFVISDVTTLACLGSGLVMTRAPGAVSNETRAMPA